MYLQMYFVTIWWCTKKNRKKAIEKFTVYVQRESWLEYYEYKHNIVWPKTTERQHTNEALGLRIQS